MVMRGAVIAHPTRGRGRAPARARERALGWPIDVPLGTELEPRECPLHGAHGTLATRRLPTCAGALAELDGLLQALHGRRFKHLGDTHRGMEGALEPHDDRREVPPNSRTMPFGHGSRT